MNDAITITQLLKGVPSDAYFVIAADASTLNTGSWLVKNNEKGKALLQEWARLQPNFKTNQQAFNALYNARARVEGYACKVDESDRSSSSSVRACIEEGPVRGIAVVPLCSIGSWGGLEWNGLRPYTQGMYVDGDFAVHFAGRGDKKAEDIKKALGGESFWS